MYVGGVAKDYTERFHGGSDKSTICFNTIEVLDGSQKVEIYWKKASGGGSVKVESRTLTLVKIA